MGGGGRRPAALLLAALAVLLALLLLLLREGAPDAVHRDPPARSAAEAPLPAPGPPSSAVPKEPEIPAGETRPVIPGVVVDGAGAPVAGALVRALLPVPDARWSPPALLEAAVGGAPPEASATADGNGGFLLAFDGTGTFTLVAEAPGRAPSVLEGVRAAAPPEARPVRLVLLPGLALRVRVLDAAARPVAGASVGVLSLHGHDPSGPPLARGETDAEGRVSFPGLPAGSLAVVARSGEGPPAVRRIWSSRPGEVEVILGGTASLRVTVRDGEGEPVPGARVATRVSGAGGVSLEGATDDGGRVAWAGLAPGRILQVTAEAPGLAAAQSPEAVGAALAAGETLEATVVLRPGAVVLGTVLRGGTGDPVPGARIRLFATRRFPLEGALEAMADERGAYRIEGVPAGGAQAFASVPGDRPAVDAASFQVPPEDGAEVCVDFQLGEPGVLRGRVVDGEGSPVPGARVVVLPPAGAGSGSPGAREGEGPGLPGTASGEAFSDEKGEFLLSGVAPGEGLTAKATAAGFLPAASEPITLPAGGSAWDVEIRLPRGGAVFGVLLSRAGGVLAGGVVTAVPAGAGSEGGKPGWTMVTGADGAFRLAALPPGPVTLHAEAEGCVGTARGNIPVVEGGESRVDLLLDPGFAVAGTVRDREGRPVADARVTATRKSVEGGRGIGMQEDGTTDSAGGFRIEGLAAGPCRVTVASPSHAGWVREGVEAGTMDLEVVLDPALVIAGRVVDEEDRGIGGAWVSARPASGEGRAVSVPSAADGAFRLGGLGAGVWQVEARHQPLHEPSAASPVAAGTAGVVIRMKATHVIAGRVVDAAGKSFAGRYLLRAYGPGGNLVPTTLSRGREGRFRLGGLGAGPWTLRVSTLDASPLEGEAVVEGGTLDAVLELRPR